MQRGRRPEAEVDRLRIAWNEFSTAGGNTVRLKTGEGTDISHAGGPPEPVKKWGAPKIAKAMALVS